MSDVKEKFLRDCGKIGKIGDDYTPRPDLAAVRKAVEENDGIINTADSHGNTGLMYAAISINHVDILNYLIANKANLDMKNKGSEMMSGDTALHWAAHYSYKEAVEILLDAGANWKIEDNDGKTALDGAKETKWNDWQEVVKVINDWTNKTAEQRRETIARTFDKLKRLRVPAVIKLQQPPQEEEEEDDEKTTITTTNLNNNQPPYGAYLPTAYVNSDGTDLQPPSALALKIKQKYKFSDGTEFVFYGLLGSGNSTDAYKITMMRVPKVMKGLQNHESLVQMVVTAADLAIIACFPFSGDARRQDYDRYCEAKGLVDPEPESIDDWLKLVEETFSSWDTKTFQGRRYAVGASFDVEEESTDPYRDTLRFCYFYYLLQEKKLVHCDVAPRNVIITWVGPVLIDFGCTVKFDEMNGNPMPRDVTPAYYLQQRGRILPNHDVKGFYITACERFGLNMDEAVMAKLNRKNRLTVDDVILNGLRRV